MPKKKQTLTKKKTFTADSLRELQTILKKEPKYYHPLYGRFRENPYGETLAEFFDDPLEFFRMFDGMVEAIKEGWEEPLLILERFAKLEMTQDQMEPFASYLWEFFNNNKYTDYRKDLVKWVDCLREIRFYATDAEYDPFGLKEKDKHSDSEADSEDSESKTRTDQQPAAPESKPRKGGRKTADEPTAAKVILLFLGLRPELAEVEDGKLARLIHFVSNGAFEVSTLKKTRSMLRPDKDEMLNKPDIETDLKVARRYLRDVGLIAEAESLADILSGDFDPEK